MGRKKKENPQDSTYWLFRPLDDEKRDWLEKTDNWVNDYWESKGHPHRKLIVNAVSYAVRQGSESILEIGCNAGPNIAAMRDIINMRDDMIYGVDINADAIKKAAEMLPAVNWSIGDVNNIPANDKSIDVVLSDAVLMYIPDKDIEHVMDEICRVAKKAVILLEWHSEKEKVEDYHWCRNYAKLLSNRGFVVDARKLTKEEWDTKTWQKHGILYIARRQ